MRLGPNKYQIDTVFEVSETFKRIKQFFVDAKSKSCFIFFEIYEGNNKVSYQFSMYRLEDQELGFSVQVFN